MTPERWRQIEDLYNAACDHGPGVLANADPELRREVQALLAQKSGGRILDQAALDLLTGATQTQVIVGSQLGPYRIEALLGQGGMGQVFSAIDTRLGRKVAIKVSHEHLSERFGREAKAISSLNHPHICTLYDVGPNYLVMERVTAKRLPRASRKASSPSRKSCNSASRSPTRWPRRTRKVSRTAISSLETSCFRSPA